MAKASITKKFSLSDDGVGIENADTGELIDLRDLLSEFADRSVKLSVTYDYGVEEE